ncbi:hypothetical protein BDP27DRAFT_1212532 [Rhodocollybia butyracea]|uniref:Uncharacterized protein n=1 Tax=Rhodocollybia butyracea TaxID=206335 RepID=A0A9P5UDQ3_9AGAR|nr:hypothetical protein BDP27DRAFT_1212532 [Rhodocollybia butyracea]
MRKISYVITFVALVFSLIFTVVSLVRTDWLVVKTPEILHTQVTVRYGLTTRCELTRISVLGDDDKSKFEYSKENCRPFPKRVEDQCEDRYPGFCAAWNSAGYAVELSIGVAVLALFSIFIGLSTGSRRRRIWKAVAGLVALHAALQIVAFSIVTDTMRTGAFPNLEDSKPGVGYILNTLGWIFAVFITTGVVVTGIAAAHGYKWAAGNRAYRRIGP